MQNSQNKKILQIVLVVLIAVLTLSIGYASISAINLIINGNATASVDQNNFDVHFVSTANTPSLSGNVTPTGSASISQQDNKVALFDVGGMTKVGDYAIATYTILNNSNGLGAELSLNLTNSNSEYFKVTETVTDTQLQAGDTTTGTIKVEMIKTPIQDDVTTSVIAKLKASPLENTQATGESSSSIEKPTAFARDSWSTIKTNVQNGNISQYNVGDTKTITINGNDYIVRLANKSMPDECYNSDFSQTACGFVVEFSDIITKLQMNGDEPKFPGDNSTSSNIGGYPATVVYAYLSDTLFEQLPYDLQEAIIPTKVVSGVGCIEFTGVCSTYDNGGNNFITTDKLYLLSVAEIFNNSPDTISNVTRILDFYFSSGVETVSAPWGGTEIVPIGTQKEYGGVVSNWWLRTPLYDSHSFRQVVNGILNQYGSSAKLGVAPAFRIG